ncbi:MAG: type II toxin-antitoxin system HicA family toxin [Planctomycetes bacterium]|nr:type II toxin-antitoxin system HicA family toxin [Planctomycetota bacterium]MBU1517797.1 type II toxin-antitoxin system HicA family toxin [Planctomycetota bacterium]MBU2457288.1 type II toxin-antitoxin system HicA family toxin [Planctomycetota bacterium]MBU2597493.1 type II toxin-antitoxin system HicA family toxin [Planctomycetota bacterium]
MVPSEKRFNLVREILEKKGYELARISGSHHIFTKKGVLPVSIPVHKGKVKAYYVKQIEKIE